MSQAQLSGNITKGNQNSEPKKNARKTSRQSAQAAPLSPTISVPAPPKAAETAEKQIKFTRINSIHVDRAQSLNRHEGRFSFPDGQQTAGSNAAGPAGPQHMSNLKRPLMTAPVNPFEDDAADEGMSAPLPKKAKKSGAKKGDVMSIRSILNDDCDDKEDESISINGDDEENGPRGAVSIGEMIRSSAGGPPPDLQTKEPTLFANDAMFTFSAPSVSSSAASVSSEASIETRARSSADRKGKGKATTNQQRQQREHVSTSTIPGTYCLEVYMGDKKQRKYEEAMLNVLGDLELPIAM
jgi:hypothetical protein